MNQSKLFSQKVDCYKDNLNQLVIKYVGFEKKILDVGCSEGELGKYLKQQKKATVFGVDISEEAIRRAKKNLDKAYVLDIETNSLPFPKKSFDIIICADILEHLVNPLLVLKKLRPYLKKDGIFVLSIPNIANIKVRWSLLWGRFEYQKQGIMDDSHLRFFTEKTIHELVSNAEMEIIKMDYTPGCDFFLLKGRVLKIKFLKALQYRLTRLLPKVFCAQFIVVAGL